MRHPDPPYHGACLCGAVEVHVTAPPLLSTACHCRDCQKLTTSAFSLTTLFPSDSVFCTGSLIRGGHRSAPRLHYFCASCLTFIYSRIEGAEHRINLRTSILDDAPLFPPFVELMTVNKMPWAEVPATHSFTHFPESPEKLQALIKAFARE